MKRNSKRNVKKRKITRESDSRTFSPLVRSALIGAICGLACFALCLLTFGGVCLLCPAPHSLIFPLALAALYLSSLTCGAGAARAFGGGRAWLASLLGGALFVITLALLLLPFSSETGERINFFPRALPIPLALLGGLCAPKKKRGKKRRRF